ncbi:MAG: fimbria/pilus periplasmic chaperone [Pseudomonadales bacterium]|nr:fimbria/pilus periplasmic chaperone [Pseudomonadales bacterium]
MNFLRFLLLSLCLLTSLLSYGDMYVDRSIVIFEPDSPPRQDVKVSNTGEEVMYVQVEVFKVNNPGEENEERLKVDNPRELQLIATPNKLIIPAGGQKLIRIVNLDQANETERVYRINVTPVLPPLQEETSQLRIVVAYQILTIVQPDEPESKLETNREGQVITFVNNGNSNILLSEGSQCNPATSDECEDLPSQRLYAGNTWQLELPYDGPVSYSVRSYDGIKKQIFP